MTREAMGGAIRVTLPAILADIVREPAVTVEAATVGELVRALDRAHPGLAARLCDETGALRPYLTLVVDGRAAGRRPESPIPPRGGGAGPREASFLRAVAGG